MAYPETTRYSVRMVVLSFLQRGRYCSPSGWQRHMTLFLTDCTTESPWPSKGLWCYCLIHSLISPAKQDLGIYASTRHLHLFFSGCCCNFSLLCLYDEFTAILYPPYCIQSVHICFCSLISTVCFFSDKLLCKMHSTGLIPWYLRLKLCARLLARALTSSVKGSKWRCWKPSQSVNDLRFASHSFNSVSSPGLKKH